MAFKSTKPAETAEAKQYDNTNRGSLFEPKSASHPATYTGQGNVGGKDYYLALYRLSGTSASGLLELRTADKDNAKLVCNVVLWKPKSDTAKSVLSGKFLIGDKSYRANLFRYTGESSLKMTVSFLEDTEEATAAKPKAPATDEIDPSDIPF